MATLTTPQNGKAVKGRTATLAPNVDLTAMVDLAFLLITFFMLTTSLIKMKAMEIAKPVDSKVPIVLAQSRTMTIILGKNDQAVYYMGEPDKAVMHLASMATIQKYILEGKQQVAKNHQNDPSKFMTIIIKPTSNSNYKNFVDAIDEVHVANVESYFIDDENILERERAFMKEKGL